MLVTWSGLILGYSCLAGVGFWAGKCTTVKFSSKSYSVLDSLNCGEECGHIDKAGGSIDQVMRKLERGSEKERHQV